MVAPQSQHPDLSILESRVKRYKSIGRILVIFNVALGAYMFAKRGNKNMNNSDKKSAKKDVRRKAPEIWRTDRLYDGETTGQKNKC